jgi:hypothetical protein
MFKFILRIDRILREYYIKNNIKSEKENLYIKFVDCIFSVWWHSFYLINNIVFKINKDYYEKSYDDFYSG